MTTIYNAPVGDLQFLQCVGQGVELVDALEVGARGFRVFADPIFQP